MAARLNMPPLECIPSPPAQSVSRMNGERASPTRYIPKTEGECASPTRYIPTPEGECSVPSQIHHGPGRGMPGPQPDTSRPRKVNARSPVGNDKSPDQIPAHNGID